MADVLSSLLPRGQWSQASYARLSEALALATPGQDYAVFDFDNTCIFGDIGEACFYKILEAMAFNFEDPRFWALLDPEDEPEALRERVARALATSPSERATHPAYLEYLGHMGRLYTDHDERHGHTHAYAWVVQLMVGMTGARVLELAAEAYKEGLAAPLGERVVVDPRDGQAWSWSVGVRICEEIRQLMAAMRQRGVEVWIVSASAELWVVPFAACFGVAPEHVVGNQLTLDDAGVMSDELVQPPTYRAGKLARMLVRGQRERAPWMGFGDAMTDFEMLCQTQSLAVVIDRGQAELRAHALDKGWVLQPREALTFVAQ